MRLELWIDISGLLCVQEVNGETILLAGVLFFKHLNLAGPEGSEIYEDLQVNNKTPNLESVIYIQILLGDIIYHFVIVILLVKGLGEGTWSHGKSPGQIKPVIKYSPETKLVVGSGTQNRKLFTLPVTLYTI